MSTTQFAMVEELAHLVKDNLHCKHLVLFMEDALLNFLQDHPSSSDGVLELEPMDPYNRLLMHRLADIFGFAHVSVGEGETRHLVLEQCPETSIPSILVSDILFQYDESQPQPLAVPHQLLRRKDAYPDVSASLAKSLSSHTLEEKETAYLVARQRIFSLDEGVPVKQRPQNVPVVARRMIAHALGQKSILESQDVVARDGKGYEVQTKEMDVQEWDDIEAASDSEPLRGTNLQPCKISKSYWKEKRENHKGGVSSSCRKIMPLKPVAKNCISISRLQNPTSRMEVKKDLTKEEHLGAAKRIFANALGLQSTRGGFLTRSSETKQLAEGAIKSLPT